MAPTNKKLLILPGSTNGLHLCSNAERALTWLTMHLRTPLATLHSSLGDMSFEKYRSLHAPGLFEKLSEASSALLGDFPQTESNALALPQLFYEHTACSIKLTFLKSAELTHTIMLLTPESLHSPSSSDTTLNSFLSAALIQAWLTPYNPTIYTDRSINREALTTLSSCAIDLDYAHPDDLTEEGLCLIVTNTPEAYLHTFSSTNTLNTSCMLGYREPDVPFALYAPLNHMLHPSSNMSTGEHMLALFASLAILLDLEFSFKHEAALLGKALSLFPKQLSSLNYADFAYMLQDYLDQAYGLQPTKIS